MTIPEIKKDLALGFIDFLSSCIDNGTFDAEDIESAEVAIECLTDIFDVDLTNKEQLFGNQTLLSLFESCKYGKASDLAQVKPLVFEEDKAKAESFKLEGNRAMGTRSYQKAVEAYTKSISLNPNNPIYLANRAAAYSSSKDYEKAIIDANKALEVDPTYVKAYSRLGLAYYSLGDAKSALAAYKKGLDSEGDSPSEVMKKGYEAAKKRVHEELDDMNTSSDEGSTVTPPEPAERSGAATTSTSFSTGASASASASAGPGISSSASASLGVGSSSGFSDYLSFMANPEFMRLAQTFISDPGAALNRPQMSEMVKLFASHPGVLNKLSNFPEVQQVVNLATAANIPSLSEMLSDPVLEERARNIINDATSYATSYATSTAPSTTSTNDTTNTSANTSANASTNDPSNPSVNASSNSSS